jgi:dihydrofolate reductase
MRKLIAFENITLDGNFTDKNNDMSWAHNNDPEWTEFTNGNASGGGMLLFGRVTYDMMAGYWPTEMAMNQMPTVAKAMNAMPKIVFSRTMQRADWSNTQVIRHDIVTEVRKLKNEIGPGMAIMGSGSIVSQLSDARLIDEYQLALHPLALGAGRTIFDGLKSRLDLKFVSSRNFKNGNVFLRYTPA